MKYRTIKECFPIGFAIQWSFAFFLLLACTDRLSTDSVPAEPDVYVTLSLNMPGSGLPQTRMSTEQQQALKDLRVLVFGADDTFKYNAAITALTGNVITVRLLSSNDSETYKLVLLGNAPTPTAEPASGESRTAVLQKYVIACEGVWKYGDSDATPLPMWGETNQAIVGINTVFKDKDGSSASIQMLRALARVDVGVNFTAPTDPNTNGATGLPGTFTLKSVRMYNSKNKGYIYTANRSAPHLPTGVPGWGNNATNPLVYTPSATEITNNSYCGNIFVPEVAAGTAAGDANATFLVIGGCYNGSSTETFYRVDFIDGAGNAPLALLRNYLYRVNITKVSGAGYTTPDEAKTSVPANMTAQVIGWNTAALNEMVYDGQNYFSCSTKTIVLPFAANGTVSIPVASSISASEWTVTKSGTNNARVTVTKPADGTPQGGNLVFTATGQGGSSGLGASDVVTVTMKVKNLEMVFTVRQAQSATVSAAPDGSQVPGVGSDGTVNVPDYGVLEEVLSGANCFIVSKADLYAIDASIKGNGKQVKNTATSGIAADVPATAEEVNIVGGSSAELLWETYNTTTAPTAENPIVKDIAYNAFTKQITFTTTANEGNAVIALKDASGNILWSWHIWRANFDPLATAFDLKAIGALAADGELVMMDRNLGALSATAQSDLSVGFLYQWGRKDPFTNSASLSSSTAMSVRGQDISMAAGNGSKTPADAVKNPTVFYTSSSENYDWTSCNDNLWGTPMGSVISLNSYSYNTNKGSKTIYDPCPVGWRVPPGYAFHNVIGGNAGYNEGYIFSAMCTTLELLWFPASGCRIYYDGSQIVVGLNGGYWTSSQYAKNTYNGSYLSFYSDEVRPANANGHSNGQSVRCSRE